VCDPEAVLPTVIVDAENVRRSRWPNLSQRELVDRARAWAAAEGIELVVVFDGPPPEDAEDVVGTDREPADDRIAELAAGLTAAGERYWLVTSDRGLRARAGGQAERTIGGGSFLAALP
jgi:hypothetical protein